MFGQRHIWCVLLGVLVAPLLLRSADGTNVAARHSTLSANAETPSAANALPCKPAAPFDPNHFSHSTTINNTWLPLVPGTQFVLEGKSNLGSGIEPHRVIFTVTELTKEISGVRTLVVWDRDFEEGRLTEAELAFFAQDDDGNVWSLGEYPEEYEDEQFQGAPSTWIPGQAGALGGVMMRANPQLKTPSYLQGYAPAVDFLDCAKVFKMNQKVCVPVTCYDTVLLTDEWSPLEPNSGHQRKYYAPGVGNVQVGAVGDPEAETLVASAIKTLSPNALAAANDAALALDTHAYAVSAVYRNTAPAERVLASPTPSATSTATATPEATPSATETPTASPQPSPSPTLTPSPSPTSAASTGATFTRYLPLVVAP